MRSDIVKRSVQVGGRKTSISLEDPYWDALRGIAKAHKVTLSALVTEIDKERGHNKLSPALRLYVLRNRQGAADVDNDSQTDAQILC